MEASERQRLRGKKACSNIKAIITAIARIVPAAAAATAALAAAAAEASAAAAALAAAAAAETKLHRVR